MPKKIEKKNSYQSKKSNKNQQIAIGVIVVGLVMAAVAAFLYFSGGSTGNVGASGDIGNIPDGLAAATLVGIKNTGPQPTKGNPAPNFGFHYNDGSSYTLAEFKGQPVIVNFWATWCPPCRREMPSLVKTYETYKDDGLMIIEVDVAEKPEAVAAFVQEYNMAMPVVLDQRQEVTRLYRTDSFPTSIFIDKDGVIQVRWIGYMAEEQLADNLKTILP